MYLESITLIKTYSVFFAAIGWWDGMDVGGAHWTTCAIYRTHQCQALGVALVVWDIVLIFSLQYIYVLATIYQNLFNLFLCIRGDGNRWQYILFLFWGHWHYLILDKNMHLH